MIKTNYPVYIKLASVLICLLAIGYLIVLGRDLLTPLAFAGLLSILLIPPAHFLENKWHLSRGFASGITILGLLTIIIGLFYTLGSQISDLSTEFPSFKRQLGVSFSEIQNWISATFHINTFKQSNYIKSAEDSLLNTGSSMIGSTLIGISSMVLSTIFVLLYSLFFLIYRSLIKKFLIGVFKEDNSDLVNDIIEKVQFIIRKYITGLLIEMSIVSGAISITFWALGIKYAFLLGLLTGLLNLIPYIGMAIALILSILVTFATATSIKILFVVITLVAVHLIDANVLLPVIVGSKVKINALITIIGVVIGEMFWGIPGMFLSIPILAILKIIFDRVESLKVWGLLLGEEEKTRKVRGHKSS